MRRPILAPLIAALTLVGAFLLYRAIGTDYLPALDEGGFVLDYITPPPSTLRRHRRAAGQNRDGIESDARGRGLFDAHRHATGILPNRIESRRFIGAPAVRPHALDHPGRDGRGARRKSSARCPASYRVLAGAAGPDRRPLGCARADRGQGVRRRPGRDRGDRAARRRRDWQRSGTSSTSSTASC